MLIKEDQMFDMGTLSLVFSFMAATGNSHADEDIDIKEVLDQVMAFADNQ